MRCDELVRRADAAGLRDALTEAHGLVTEALALWHDAAPLADVPGPAARTARTRLLRLRLALHTKRAELDLALGEYDRASTELSELLRAHPHREDFRRLYLIALRQGRGEEALEVYEEYELSGGRSPALTALGRELREEHAGPADDAPWSEYEEQPGPGRHRIRRGRAGRAAGGPLPHGGPPVDTAAGGRRGARHGTGPGEQGGAGGKRGEGGEGGARGTTGSAAGRDAGRGTGTGTGTGRGAGTRPGGRGTGRPGVRPRHRFPRLRPLRLRRRAGEPSESGDPGGLRCPRGPARRGR
ncbi:hypothetical protein SVIOM342S_00864 [Streptomyces violaceorubidus]